MPADEQLIQKVKLLIESRLNWGNSGGWTNQDYIQLSDKITAATGEPISHVTLKRIWGKVKYESLPNIHTLDTLANFAGYENWRSFKNAETTTAPAPTVIATIKKKRFPWIALAAGIAVVCIIFIPRLIPAKQDALNPADYQFSTKKIVSEGVPNSVVFDYDARRAPGDSVMIQQSWDNKLRVKVSRQDRQHTCIYYYPDYFLAKLMVGNRIVKQQSLLIKTDGWLSLVEKSPIPVYFRKDEALADGKLTLPIKTIEGQNISFQPDPPTVLYTNVGDFGEIYSDDFVFETSLRNDYRKGSAICQLTRVYLLCQGTAVWIPLCSPGCVSGVDLLFTNYYASGKKQDLSAFGVDFENFIKLRIESHGGKANIFLNDKLCYQVPGNIQRSKIIGIDYSFQGTGSVDYVKLSNSTVNYIDNF